MRKTGLFLLAFVPLFLPTPAISQAIFESGSIDSMSVGLGAGLAASLGGGKVVGRTYQSAVDAQMSAAQALSLQTKAIEQYMALGCQYQTKKQWQNAEKSFRYVLQVSALRDGPGSPKMVPTLQHLVGVSTAQGNLYDAIGFQTRVLGFAKNAKISDPASVLNAEIALSNLYLQQQDYHSAEPLIKESYEKSQSAEFPLEKRKVIVRTYAEVLRKLKKDEEALKLEADNDAPSQKVNDLQSLSPAATMTTASSSKNGP
jgi:tetratricopeptide (TPR) repeat protein